MTKDKETGIFFETVKGVSRSVYRQENGQVVLADSCKCIVKHGATNVKGVSFSVTRNPDCPIDEHRSLIA